MPKQPFFPARLSSNSPAVIAPAPPEPVMAIEMSHGCRVLIGSNYPRKQPLFHDSHQKKGRHFSVAAYMFVIDGLL
ncbi:MAG: hypothetical protein OES53_07310, partial [Xanthomonadales bacterium]|nr:hypothetical protein [Xanthomonadales bacterium]